MHGMVQSDDAIGRFFCCWLRDGPEVLNHRTDRLPAWR